MKQWQTIQLDVVNEFLNVTSELCHLKKKLSYKIIVCFGVRLQLEVEYSSTYPESDENTHTGDAKGIV